MTKKTNISVLLKERGTDKETAVSLVDFLTGFTPENFNRIDRTVRVNRTFYSLKDVSFSIDEMEPSETPQETTALSAKEKEESAQERDTQNTNTQETAVSETAMQEIAAQNQD